MSEITLAAQLAYAKRQYRLQCAAFPERIQAGTMRPHDAQWRLAVQQAIVASLAKLRREEISAQQADLFAGRA